MLATAPRILIIDDHQIVRQGVRTLLAEFRPAWEVCGEAADAAEGLQAVSVLKPDLIVLDITMPGRSGLELASEIRQLGLPALILIFTMHHSPRLGSDVRTAGAQGYVLKSQAARDLVLAIEHILSGGTFYGSENDESGNEPKPGLSFTFCRRLTFAPI